MNSVLKSLAPCLVALFIVTGAQASEVAVLYSGEVAVPDQARSTQDRFVVKAFENVLVKLSGQRILPASATPEFLGPRARSSLQSVTYHTYTETIDAQTEFSELRLQAQFNVVTTNNALLYLGLPRWPVERGRVQFIMAIELDNERRLISNEDAYLGFVVSDTARQRGLPLSVSLEPADAELDISWLQEIWGGFTESPLAESRAHGFDGVLLASATRRNGQWSLRWNMAIPEREWTWSIRGIDLYAALAAGVHAAADRIAASREIPVTEQGQWLESVEVANIHSNRDYLRCLTYLQGLNLVNRVEIHSVQGSKIRFKLELNASPEHLHQSIERGNTLSLVGVSMAGGAQIYQLGN